MRVFLDANVLFSAAYREGNPVRALLRLAAAGACELLASAFAVDEARRNLERKRPARAAELETLVARLRVCPEAGAAEVGWARSTGLPDKDAPILAAAALARADLLVTGDRTDFGPLYGTVVRGVEVLAPRAAIERILAAASRKTRAPRS